MQTLVQGPGPEAQGPGPELWPEAQVCIFWRSVARKTPYTSSGPGAESRGPGAGPKITARSPSLHILEELGAQNPLKYANSGPGAGPIIMARSQRDRILETLRRPRCGKACHRYGLTPGIVMDLRNGMVSGSSRETLCARLHDGVRGST